MNETRTRLTAGRLAVVAVALAGVSGSLICAPNCIVGPDYRRVRPPVPARWQSQLPGGQGTVVDLARWWEHLNDPILNKLLRRALRHNPGLAGARERLVAARARLGIADAARWPGLDAYGKATQSATRNTYDKKTAPAGKIGQTGEQLVDAELERRRAKRTQTNRGYLAGFDARWELDVFGGKRRAVEAASADLQVSAEEYRAVLTSLFAETTLGYIQVVTFRERLRIARENIARQREAARLVGWRYKAGVASRLDFEQAQLNVRTTLAALPTLRLGLRTALYSLSILVGVNPQQLDPQFASTARLPTPSTNILIGVPADTLRRRPDVRRAERRVAAATARIGVAQAARYPSFTIPGSVGIDALSPAQFRSGNSRKATLGLGFNYAIFDGGAARNNVRVFSSLQRQALIEYRGVVLLALKEVESGVTAYALQSRRVLALQAAETSAEAAARLALLEYNAGVTDFGTVLIIQQRLLVVQDDLVQARSDRVATLVRVYKALGGGGRTTRKSQSGKSRRTRAGSQAGA